MFQQILKKCDQKNFFDLTSQQNVFHIEIRSKIYCLIFKKKSYNLRIIGKHYCDKNTFSWIYFESHLPKHVKRQTQCLYDFGKIHNDDIFMSNSIKYNPDEILRVCCYLFNSKYYFYVPYEINVYGSLISTIYFIVDDNNFKPYLM